MDDEFDDLETLPDEGDEGYVKLRKEDLKALRSAARKRGAAERELAAYKRQDAVRAAGIDGLNERQIAVIAREAEGDQSPENLRRIAEDLNFIQPKPPSEEERQLEQEIDTHSEAVQATSGAAPAATLTRVNAENVAAWGQDKQMRLLNQHPEIYELVLRGEEVTLPATFN